VTQTALASVTSAKTRDSRSWHFPYKGDAGVLLIQCELCSRYWTEEVDGGYCHCGCGGVGSPVKTGDRTEGAQTSLCGLSPAPLSFGRKNRH
jgi:hypothetical protein